MARLFFALWPDAPSRTALARLAEDLAAVSGGRAVPLDKIHLTLAFLGEADDARTRDALHAAGRAAFEPVQVTLDCVGSFRGARVAWAGSRVTDAPLAAAQARLERALRASGFALEDRAFTPHVTLARRIARPVPRAPIAAVGWTAAEMALVASVGGGYANLEVFGRG